MQKPRWFDVVGWSWLIMGVLGLVSSLAGFLSIPAMGEMKDLLSKPPYDTMGVSPEMLERATAYIIPLNFVQLVVSLIITYVSWRFLKRKDWARLALAAINWLTLAGIAVPFVYFYMKLSELLAMVDVQEMSAAGIETSFPSVLWTAWAVSLVLLVVPLVWMGYYFHSHRLKEYFRNAIV